MRNAFVIIVVLLSLSPAAAADNSLPNVVILYADDMGYGDLACQNPQAKIATPNLDRLAREGMRFTDGHSSSGICSPSRFALLTGQYHWRRQHDIVGPMGPSMFQAGDVTLAQLLGSRGYRTACIGKWHLGWDWQALLKPGAQKQKQANANGKNNGKENARYGVEAYDWSKAIPGGPCSVGFDEYFGDGTINFPPYCWIRNDRIVEPPTTEINLAGRTPPEGNWEFRPGPAVDGWEPYNVLPRIVSEGVAWINKQNSAQPFFLYFAFSSPHAPIIPNKPFVGKSAAGAYGDFVVQTDSIVGELLEALDNRGLAENTIVLFSSDNGPERYAFNRLRDFQHASAGELRGVKRDVWEGGHRVPLLVRWPGRVRAGSVSDEVVSQIDILATLAKATGLEIPNGTGVDSYDLTPVLTEQDYPRPLRAFTIHNTYANRWAIRRGRWLYVDNSTGEQSTAPEFYNKLRGYENGDAQALLYDMEQDVGQRANLLAKHPEIAEELEQLLVEQRASASTAK